MKISRTAILFLFSLSILLPATVQASVIYDLGADWSDVNNPNGPWTYREGLNALPHQDDWGGGLGGQPGWADPGLLPPWFKAVSVVGGLDWQIGDIVVHTTDPNGGNPNGLANVIWTSPIDGTIDITGSLWNPRNIGRSNHWSLLLNGTELTGGDLFSGDGHDRANPYNFVNGTDMPASLSNLSVHAGDVVMLQFQRTSVDGDFVGANLAIQATAVPEPSAMLLTAIGLTGVAVRRWRKRRNNSASQV
jgi:hypothetical protein